MAISYNRMWKLLVDKKMSKADLRKAGLRRDFSSVQGGAMRSDNTAMS